MVINGMYIKLKYVLYLVNNFSKKKNSLLLNIVVNITVILWQTMVKTN